MKHIVLCSDGTGNRGGKSRGTNVWRLFNAVDRYHPKVPQVAFYDDGVGTERLRWLKLAAGAFGWGLSRNVRELYSHLVTSYEPEEDRIFLFGFSRGAFTVRVLAGMLCKCGLWDRAQYLESPERERTVRRILGAYRQVGTAELEALRAEGKRFHDVPIEMVGVWDTVDAVGVPVEELREWLDDGYRALFGRRLYGFHDRHLHPRVRHGYQALAIDDERATFHPNVWEPRNGVEQVWFAGAHSNVGGGYPKDAMALVTLDWMMGKARRHGLRFVRGTRAGYRSASDVHGKLYDSRAGVSAYYRYRPRDLGEIPLVHHSVYERIERMREGYAPGNIPGSARAAYTDSGPYARRRTSPLPALAPQPRQALAQLVQRRTWLYRGFLAFTLALAGWIGVELLTGREASGEAGSGVLYEIGRLFVPDFLEKAAGVLASRPWIALAAALVFFGLRRASTHLRRAARETAFQAWRAALRARASAPPGGAAQP